LCRNFLLKNFSQPRVFSKSGLVGGISNIMVEAAKVGRDASSEAFFRKGFAKIISEDNNRFSNKIIFGKHSKKTKDLIKKKLNLIKSGDFKRNKRKRNKGKNGEVKEIATGKNLRRSKQHEWILDDGLPYFVEQDPFPEYKEDKTIRNVGNMYYDGINSTYLGKHPLRNSTRPQKFIKPNETFLSFCFEYVEIFDEFDIPFERCMVNRGCWHTNRYTLQRQLIPEFDSEFNKMPDKKTSKRLESSVRNVIRKLKIETLPKCTKSDLLKVSYNRDTYAGFHYDAHLNNQPKKKVVFNALSAASKRWNIINNGNFSHNDIMPSLYTIGARNKRDYTYSDGEIATSRVVHMPEFHVELVSGAWTDPITNWFKNTASGPAFIGNSSVRHPRFAKALEGSLFQLEGDWKRFDSTLYSSIIISALSILRCFYEVDDTNIDNHFLAIFDSIGIKDYYCPGGRIFRCLHGLPSGVKCTNLLGTIINLIALNFCVNDGANKQFNFVAGGDDFVVICKYEKIIDIDVFIESFKERAEMLGMRLKVLEKKFQNSTILDELPSFFKYVVKNGKPYIPFKAMLERVFMPWNKIYTTDTEILKFLDDLMPGMGCPAAHLSLYYLFYQKIANRVFCRRKYEFKDIVKIHINIYNKLSRKFVEEEDHLEDDRNFSSPFIDMQFIINSTEYVQFAKNFNDVLSN
jgi:hypothetical protein